MRRDETRRKKIIGWLMRYGITVIALGICLEVARSEDKQKNGEPISKGEQLRATPSSKVAGVKVGQPVNDFRLRDLMEDEPTFVTLSQFRGEQVVVLVSIQSRCPTTWRYIERIGRMYQDYRNKGVAFLTIRSSLTDDEDRIRRYVQDKNLDMPLLFDDENRVADYFGTQGTPYFYVIDKQGVLRYEGIFDNNQVDQRVDLKPETVTSHYVREAIEAVLAGKPVKQKSVLAGST